MHARTRVFGCSKQQVAAAVEDARCSGPAYEFVELHGMVRNNMGTRRCDVGQPAGAQGRH